MPEATSLRAAHAVVSPPGREYVADPEILQFYRDLLLPFGREVDEQVLRTAPQVDHCQLVDELVAQTDLGAAPALVILAQALPDVVPFVAIGPYLDRQLGGKATTFGIHHQGLAAPFTALRAVSASQRSGRRELAVVAVLEQTTLPTRVPLVHDNNLVDSGVLLVFGPGGGLQVDEVAPVPADRIGDLVAKDPDGTLLVTGPWASEVAEAPHHHRVGAGSYCTSVWLELSRNWTSWQRDYATILLCDTDPRTGDTQLAAFRSEDSR